MNNSNKIRYAVVNNHTGKIVHDGSGFRIYSDENELRLNFIMNDNYKIKKVKIKILDKNNIFTKLLIFLGLRCKCGGRLKNVYGWPYAECVECGKKIY